LTVSGRDLALPGGWSAVSGWDFVLPEPELVLPGGGLALPRRDLAVAGQESAVSDRELSPGIGGIAGQSFSLKETESETTCFCFDPTLTWHDFPNAYPLIFQGPNLPVKHDE